MGLGGPRIGRPHSTGPAAELTQVPAPELLGTISDAALAPPSDKFSGWTESDGTQIEVKEPPPPWETSERKGVDNTDARRFVKVPENWVLRWINPRLLDSYGWRDWQPVMASDPNVKVIVKQMVDVSNNIRRGGQTGDILAWMYRSWVESRKKQKAARVQRMTQSAVERHEEVKYQLRRGGYGPYVTVDSATHPTHTIGDGRSMRD